jgi:hypothetical protein
MFDFDQSVMKQKLGICPLDDDSSILLWKGTLPPSYCNSVDFDGYLFVTADSFPMIQQEIY